MEQVEQVFFNVPLSKLEPIFKRWIKEAQTEIQPIEEIEARLSSIEILLLDLKNNLKMVEPTDPEKLLTIQEAAEFLRLTVPTMYGKVSKGELPVMKRGKRLYFSRTELLEYLKNGHKNKTTKFNNP